MSEENSTYLVGHWAADKRTKTGLSWTETSEVSEVQKIREMKVLKNVMVNNGLEGEGSILEGKMEPGGDSI